MPKRKNEMIENGKENKKNACSERKANTKECYRKGHSTNRLEGIRHSLSSAEIEAVIKLEQSVALLKKICKNGTI